MPKGDGNRRDANNKTKGLLLTSDLSLLTSPPARMIADAVGNFRGAEVEDKNSVFVDVGVGKDQRLRDAEAIFF